MNIFCIARSAQLLPNSNWPDDPGKNEYWGKIMPVLGADIDPPIKIWQADTNIAVRVIRDHEKIQLNMAYVHRVRKVFEEISAAFPGTYVTKIFSLDTNVSAILFSAQIPYEYMSRIHIDAN